MASLSAGPLRAHPPFSQEVRLELHQLSCRLSDLVVILMPMRIGFCLPFLMALFFAKPLFAQDDRAIVRIEIKIENGELFAGYEVDQSISSFRFAEADVVREGVLLEHNPGMKVDDTAVRLEVPASYFTLRASEDLQRRDAKYSVFYKVGEGFLIFAPGLYGHEDDWRSELDLTSLPDGWGHWPNNPLPLERFPIILVHSRMS